MYIDILSRDRHHTGYITIYICIHMMYLECAR